MSTATDTPHDPNLYRPDTVIEPLDGLDALDEGMIEQFRELGFIAVNHAFTETEVEDAKQGLADLIMGRVEGFDGVSFEPSAKARLSELGLTERELAVRKLMHFTSWDERLNRLADHPKLTPVLEKLLSDREPKLFQDMALLKPPHGREKPWHQDKAYFDVDVNEPVVGVWIALDEATIANGCMHIVPGSHRDGPVVHFKRRDWQICDTEMVGKKVAACPLKPGGLLLFDGLLQHGTPHNHSGQRRRALQYHYAPADAVWRDTDSRLALFGSEGKDVEC